MNILIVNQPLNNRGDESAHKALVRTLLKRMPDAKIVVLWIDAYSPGGVLQYDVHDERASYVNYHSIRWYNRVGEVALHNGRYFLWNIHPTTRTIKHFYQWADWVICAPGGICMGGYQNWSHLYFLKWAQYCHKPLAYYGRSIGPFPTETESNREFRKISYEMLHYFSFLSLRDKVSQQIAADAGIDYVPTVDTAFLDDPQVEVPYEVRSMLRGREYMAFVPNTLLWHYRFHDKVSEETILSFYEQIMHRIFKAYPQLFIVMLPQLFYNGEQNDVILFRKLADRLDDERVVVIPDCYSSDIQQCIIRDSKFVVGARYHSIVFAINQNVPFISMSYEHKMSGLLESLGNTDGLIDFTDTLFSEEGQLKTLAEFEGKLKDIKLDPTLHEKAKRIAVGCMDKLMERIDL